MPMRKMLGGAALSLVAMKYDEAPRDLGEHDGTKKQ
jgi:hypothetical protein